MAIVTTAKRAQDFSQAAYRVNNLIDLKDIILNVT
jgi:hypothetical protein